MKKQLAYRLINKDEVTESELEEYKNGQTIPFIDEVSLFKLKSGDFQFSSEGSFKAILSGPDYILIKSKIAQILIKHASEQLSCHPVKIYRRATGEEWLDYYELNIKNEIEFSEYSETECTGIQVYHMMNSIVFISPELKTIIEDSIEEEIGIKMKQELPFIA